MRVRICEAVWGSCDLSESPKWEAVWEADQPLTHTRRCCDPRGRLTDFTAKRIASPGVRERPIGLPHGPGDAVILGAVWLISRLNALLRPVCVRGRSASHTASHFGLTRPHRFRLSDWLRQITWENVWGPCAWEAEFGRPICEAVWGRVRPCEADLWGRGAPWLAGTLWQMYLSQSGSTSASHIGLTHRPPNFTWKSNFRQQ